MATTVLGSLLVQLGMDSAQFERASQRAESAVSRMAKNIGVQSRDVVAAANRMGVSVTAFASQVQSLQARINPGAQALTAYKREMDLLRESLRIGAISQEQFRQGVQNSLATYRSATSGVQQANRQSQFGMQQLSFQLNDIATQWASGTKPMQIFAQQSGQVVQALTLMTNGTSKLGAFMAGPWGAALTAGVVVLLPLISKLGETSKALENVKFATDAVSDVQGILGNVMDMTTGKITKQTDAMLALARAQLLVGKVQAQVRAAEARKGVQSIQDRPVQVGGGMGGGVNFSRRPQDARDWISREVLAGRLSKDQAVQRLENIRKAGQISDTQFAEYASSVANLGLEEANVKTFDEGLKLLDGKGGRSLLKPKKDKKDKKGKTAAEIEAAYQTEMAGYMRQYNDAMASMAANAETAADYEMKNVELQRIRTVQAIQNNEDYSAAQKEILVARANELAEVERQQVERSKKQRIEQEAQALAQQNYQSQRDALQTKMQMADTEKERQAIALELLALDQQYRRNSLEQIIASELRTDAEKALAQKALDGLGAVEAMERAATQKGTMTRAQAYMVSLQKTPEQINEAIDGIKVDALQSLNDQLVDAIVNFKSLGDVAASVFKQILADILRLQIQKSITLPLAKMLGLGGSIFGGGTSAFSSVNLSSVPSNFSSWATATIAGARANGGPVHIGQSYLVGERGPEIFTPAMTGRIIANDDIQGGGARVQVIPSPYFDVVVNGHIQRAAPTIAGLGAAEAATRATRTSTRRIG